MEPEYYPKLEEETKYHEEEKEDNGKEFGSLGGFGSLGEIEGGGGESLNSLGYHFTGDPMTLRQIKNSKAQFHW